jgi:hypothetical protein
MADDKKRGRGNPTPRFIGPKLPDAGRGDLHDPSKPKCNQPYQFKGIWKKCGKRGRHLKHGPGKG